MCTIIQSIELVRTRTLNLPLTQHDGQRFGGLALLFRRRLLALLLRCLVHFVYRESVFCRNEMTGVHKYELTGPMEGVYGLRA